MRGRPPRHGLTGSPTWVSWAAMWSRALWPKPGSCYDKQGIGVCIPWVDFEAFLEDMGPRPPGTSLDRINNELGYSPTNCRWADIQTQNQNRRCKGGRHKEAK